LLPCLSRKYLFCFEGILLSLPNSNQRKKRKHFFSFLFYLSIGAARKKRAAFYKIFVFAFIFLDGLNVSVSFAITI